MRKRIDADYRPGSEQLALFPAVSGNTINGLGERRRRRPSALYWHDPDTIAHGRLQKYFYANAARMETGRTETSQMAERRGPAELDPVAPVREQDNPAGWSVRVKEAALAHEADLVGIAAMREDWVFEGHQVAEPWIVVIGVGMDQRELAKGPPRPEDLSSANEVSRQYNRAARASKALANWIRNRGWNAVAHTGPMAGHLTVIPAAIAAGFGQLGKHGSMINDTWGASLRLASVTTDLPLVADAPVDIGVDDFCLRCRVCSDRCPPQAIYADKQLVRGEYKWYVDFDKCLPYFNDTLGCGICIAECPWSLPGVAPRLAAKLERRRAAI
ncbi:MAG: 4Fe-4S dicluster domain-containing protein [Gammaproteobacteria bacterium]|nr:4Fe-4S dicluster domain-containing protein [Gammaproteobacteria bacterium]